MNSELFTLGRCQCWIFWIIERFYWRTQRTETAAVREKDLPTPESGDPHLQMLPIPGDSLNSFFYIASVFRWGYNRGAEFDQRTPQRLKVTSKKQATSLVDTRESKRFCSFAHGKPL